MLTIAQILSQELGQKQEYVENIIGLIDDAPISAKVVGMPMERSHAVSRSTPARAVFSGWRKSISQPNTRTANWAKRAAPWGMTYSIQAGITTARPTPWAQS